MIADPEKMCGNVRWYEDESSFHATIDVPGFEKRELRLEVEGDLIRLSACTPESEDRNNPFRDRFERVLRCPGEVRNSEVQAELADGVLRISLPKVEVRKPVNVMIN